MRNIKALALLVAVAFSLPVVAQTGTSSIRGTVTDTQGRVVAGADVTLTSTATNAARNTKTSDSGEYSFELISPGRYRISVEASGFKKRTTDNVNAQVGKPTNSDAKLEVGTSNETIEVTASSAQVLINSQDATLGNVIDARQITQLPMEARDLRNLLTLQPGSTKEGYVTGARADQSNVTLDGVDINEAQTGNTTLTGSNGIAQLAIEKTDITQGTVLRLNTEAIEEFRVTTANGNANQGRSSGAQINLVSRSGSNNWHGAAYELYRSRGFTANDWWNNHSGVPREALVRNTFGASLGGPVLKDKIFFFYAYDGRRDSNSTSQTEVVPLASLGAGQINYNYCKDADCNNLGTASLNLAQNQGAFSVADINPAALAALQDAAQKYPSNDNSVGDGLNTGGFRFNALTPIKLNAHTAKLDFNLSHNQSAFVRVIAQQDHQTQASYLPDSLSPTIWSHPFGIAAGHTWTIGNNLVNNFRYGLTRQAFTNSGDSLGNDVSFRFVFQPNNETHPLTRVTPVQNFTDDLSWTRGNHTLQFGANIRKIANTRVSYAAAYDFATTNPSFYGAAGDNVSGLFQTYLDNNGLPGDENQGQSLSSFTETQNAATAIIGRFSEFTADFTFGRDGTLLNLGTPTSRTFANQSYDGYVQDTWKARKNLTLTLGLRYSLERPIYETHGYEVKPTVPLGKYFEQRLAAAHNGENFTDPIVINKSGPVNGGSTMYNWDKNNFQPRAAFAWSLDPASKSVLRGGFALTNDYYGQALAVDFDLNNTLGFTANYTTPANTYDVTDSASLAPAFTDFNQNVHQYLTSSQLPGNLVFPLAQPSDFGGRIEQSVDSSIHAPTEYVWNVTFEHQLPRNSVLTLSYVGRSARGLLARRDIAAFNDVRDPASGVDWYGAGTLLEKQRQLNTDTDAITPIPFFENLFPAHFVDLLNQDEGAGMPANWTNTQAIYALQSRGSGSNPYAFFSGNDWTDAESVIDQVLSAEKQPTRFEQAQYGALSAWSTVGNSNYNALAVSLRTRLSSLEMDFNYTWSHSLDDSSGIQTQSAFGSAFIVNPIRQGDNYGSSDFDSRHNINVSTVWQMPFGKGKALLSGASPVVEAIVGGWQLSGITRWNSGLPQADFVDDARWATNWNVQAGVFSPLKLRDCASKPVHGSPKIFGNCGDINTIYRSFRNAYPGESGPRNPYRLPGYFNLDLGLGKSWAMPWNEKHSFQLRWEVFNVTNTQSFNSTGTSREEIGVGRDPGLRNLNAPATWANFFPEVQGSARAMQVGARYSF